MKILFGKIKSKSNGKSIIDRFVNEKNSLSYLKTSEIIDAFDQISNYWISNRCKVRNLIRSQGMGFVIPWIKKGNINKMIKLNFKNYDCLDQPIYDNDQNSFIYGRPLGVAVHWIAGNIPVLGVISLFQALLTKNRNIVKVPYNFQNILPQILKDLGQTKFFKKKNRKIIDLFLNSTLVVYADKEDIDSQNLLSKKADIRIVWGGIDAVNSVVNLPKKINCRDLIFGPKVSLAFASKENLRSLKDLEKLSKLLSNDVFPFNQAGCNSPHNLIIEKGSKFSLSQIAKKISDEFNLKSKNNPLFSNPIDKYNVLNKKFIYQSKKDSVVFSDKKNEWNIFVNRSSTTTVENPIYCRSIFISEINNINKLGPILPNNTQSFGLFVARKRKKEIIKILSEYGVDRFPDLGKMSLYQNPWDGYFPLHQMIKWISTN